MDRDQADAQQSQVAVIGGGPAGLMAADVLADGGHAVTVYDAMPTVGRKFLLAGKSGLNLTHSEPHDDLRERFGSASSRLAAALDAFPGQDVVAWANELGVETFVGSSGRVFPTVVKASPLLRAWLRRLEAKGVRIRVRHRFAGFDGNGLRFDTPDGPLSVTPDAVLFAFGGASWPRLGSDAAWIPAFSARGIPIVPFRPANCGFDVEWSDYFASRQAGAPLKSVVATSDAGSFRGEFVISHTGIEGSLVYAHAAALRDRLEREGSASLMLDFAPDRTHARITADLARQPQKASFSTRLRKGVHLDGIKTALIREIVPEAASLNADALAGHIKALPVSLLRPRPIAESISSAGGVAWDAIDDAFMLKSMPGHFVAGEMIDWEAPTGGYLLTACLATGRAAARGIERWLAR